MREGVAVACDPHDHNNAHSGTDLSYLRLLGQHYLATRIAPARQQVKHASQVCERKKRCCITVSVNAAGTVVELSVRFTEPLARRTRSFCLNYLGYL